MVRSSHCLGEKNESAIKASYTATNPLWIQHNLGADSVTEYPARQQIWGSRTSLKQVATPN